jgi:predicted transcriptional regulator
MNDHKTVKQRIIEMLHRLPEDIDYDRAIEGIYVLKRVEIGLAQIERGEVYEDEEVMTELLGDGEKVSTTLDGASQS